MKKIEKYNLPEHTNNLYKNEVISSIALAKEIADKINELVEAYNEFSNDDLIWKQEQDGRVRKAILYMKDNLLNSINELMNALLERGEFENIKIKDATAREQIEEIKKNYVVILPSKDTTGEKDHINIQDALNNNSVVHLVAGEYYLNKAIVLNQGNSLIGDGAKTIIHSKGNECVIKGNEAAHDHITLKDFYLINDTTNSIVAINLVGNDEEEYNGARYSYFSGIRISGFKVGIQMRGLWSTVFERIRTLNCEYGIQGLGCINNVTIDKSEFTHGNIGIELKCDGSTELYGIRINNCNFEGNETTGINASGVIKLSITDVYSENTPKLFVVNSCPQFSINGGQVSGITTLGHILSTAYSTELFKNPKALVENIVITCKIDTDEKLMYIDGGITNAVVRNNRVLNKGAGEVALLTKLEQVEHAKGKYSFDKKRVRYSNDFVEDYYPSLKSNERFIPYNFYMILKNQVTTATTTLFNVFITESDGTKTKVGETGYLNAGTHEAGKTLKATLTNRLHLKDDFKIEIIPSQDYGAEAEFVVQMEYKVGDLGYQE